MSQRQILIREYCDGDEAELTRILNQASVARDTLQVPYTSVAERRERFQPSPTLRTNMLRSIARSSGQHRLCRAIVVALTRGRLV